MRSFFATLLAAACLLQMTAAFVPQASNRPVFAPLAAAPVSPQKQPLIQPKNKISQFITTAAVVISTSPLIALAEEVDDYEYGAVNAPIGIAWAGGVLAVLTALLPLALRGGEDAFNEMKERDSGKWGTGSTDALNKRKK